MARRTLGRRLRTLRRQRGWSQDDLARRAGLSQPYIVQLEGAVRENPSLAVLQQLARALGVTLSELFK